jgi:hypothetical protein
MGTALGRLPVLVQRLGGQRSRCRTRNTHRVHKPANQRAPQDITDDLQAPRVRYRNACHDLTGLGDAAYTTSVSAPGVPTVNSVVAQEGNLNVQVTAPAAISVIKALVAQLIS